MSYYRRVQWGAGGGGLPDMVKYLLIGNGIVFVLQMFIGPNILYYTLGLVPKLAWSRLYIWQFLTYMFLHGGILHLALNMYALYLFGSEIEQMWGPKAFLRYYLITGIGAGLFHTLLTPMSTVPTIGASGAVLGVLTAFAILFPDREITLLLFFILPVTLKARTLAIGYAVISLLSGASGSPDRIAHFAHLGGMIVGYLYLKRGIDIDSIKSKYNHWKRRRQMRVHREREEELDKLRRLADAVLDKANAVGMKNLTKDERLILKRASRVLNNYEKYKTDV